jgi:hypothetical protein
MVMSDGDYILTAFLIFLLAWIPLAHASLRGQLGDGPSASAFRIFRKTIILAIVICGAIVARLFFIMIA